MRCTLSEKTIADLKALVGLWLEDLKMGNENFVLRHDLKLMLEGGPKITFLAGSSVYFFPLSNSVKRPNRKSPRNPRHFMITTRGRKMKLICKGPDCTVLGVGL